MNCVNDKDLYYLSIFLCCGSANFSPLFQILDVRPRHKHLTWLYYAYNSHSSPLILSEKQSFW